MMAIYKADAKLSYLEVFKKRGAEGAFKAVFFIACWWLFNTYLLHLPFGKSEVVLYVIGFVFFACYFTWRSKVIGAITENDKSV